MNDEDYAFFWGIFAGIFFTIVGQKAWASWGSALMPYFPDVINSLLRGAS